jgi:hypothetical protein
VVEACGVNCALSSVLSAGLERLLLHMHVAHFRHACRLPPQQDGPILKVDFEATIGRRFPQTPKSQWLAAKDYAVYQVLTPSSIQSWKAKEGQEPK